MSASRRLPCFAGAALLVAACGDPTGSSSTTLHLDRPVDLAFACWGGLRITNGQPATSDHTRTVSAQPLESCNARVRTGEPPIGQEDLEDGQGPLQEVSYYSFILQSASGTVAIANYPAEASFLPGLAAVLDADLFTPGTNGISVGTNPVAIAADRSGCYMVTANAGSCDLSTFSVDSAVARDGATQVNRLAVSNASGAPVLAKAAAMVGEAPGGFGGTACPAAPDGHLWVAYPDCHVIAAVSPGTGQIVAGVRFNDDGTATITDGNISCPAECGVPVPTTPGPRPIALDLVYDPRVDTRRMAVALENSPRVVVVELDASSLPTAVTSFDLEGDVGVVDVALTAEIGMGGDRGFNDGSAPAADAQFVYAVTSDGTVRVVEVLGVNRECDTQIDPRYLHDQRDLDLLSCLPLGDPSLPRRPGALGPGIEVPGDGAPVAVSTVRSEAVDGLAPHKFVGYFAIVAVSTGETFVVNIDDDIYGDLENLAAPLAISLPLAMPHQIRDRVAVREMLAERQGETGAELICNTTGPPNNVTSVDQLSGGPRLAEDVALGDVAVVREIIPSQVAPEKVHMLPRLRQVECVGADETRAVPELAFAAPEAVREAVFPDLRSIRTDETWRMIWEGSITDDPRGIAVNGPEVRTGLVPVDGLGMRVYDPAGPFCSVGVEPFDIVELFGCNPSRGDTDCSAGMSCYVHPDSPAGVGGTCLPSAEVDFLAGPCRQFLMSSRRYSVAESTAEELHLMERQRVLRTTPLDGCASDQQCQDLALVEHQMGLAGHPSALPADDVPEARMWSCQADPSRAGTAPRCVMACTSDADCDTGTVCSSGVCVEGVIPPLQCVEGLQRYHVRAGEAFVVNGELTGYLHSIVKDADGVCVRDGNANPLLVGRIPLTPPPCLGPGLTDVSPNPCSTTVSQSELVPDYAAIGGACETASEPPPEVRVTRDVPGIRFQNPAFSVNMVEPTYPGDATCRFDRGGNLVGVPAVFRDYQLRFRIAAGFAPYRLDISPVYPSNVVTGPEQTIWVVDQGESRSDSGSTVRGRVYRIDPKNLGSFVLQ